MRSVLSSFNLKNSFLVVFQLSFYVPLTIVLKFYFLTKLFLTLVEKHTHFIINTIGRSGNNGIP